MQYRAVVVCVEECRLDIFIIQYLSSELSRHGEIKVSNQSRNVHRQSECAVIEVKAVVYLNNGRPTLQVDEGLHRMVQRIRLNKAHYRPSLASGHKTTHPPSNLALEAQ